MNKRFASDEQCEEFVECVLRAHDYADATPQIPRSPPAGLIDPPRPQKRERQAILDGVGLVVGNTQHGSLD